MNFTTPLNVELTEDEIEFLNAYVAAIYFTETGGGDVDGDQPPADAELDEDFIRESTLDCLCFYSRICCYLNSEEGTIAQAGHDFWLTRNGHGTGFWDRGDEVYGTARNHLNETAESFPIVEAYFEDYM